MNATAQPHKGSRVPILLAGAGGIVFLVLIAVRLFVLEVFKNPSGSMIPTLDVGDRFVVNKLAGAPAHRGDVIVFKFPEHPDQDFVKRVIATGGDVLDVTNGHPTINGWTVPSCKVGEWSYDEPGGAGRHKGDVYVEFLEEAAYLAFFDTAAGAFANHQGPFHAKSGEAWVMGDNRNNSHDSRMWFGGMGGGVPSNMVKGTVLGTQGAPKLPASMSSLAAAFDECMRKRPPTASTTPPTAR
jgi:signal peptidase I